MRDVKPYTLASYDLTKGRLIHEYALSEEDKELLLLLDGRDHVTGKVEIEADYFIELGPNRSTRITRKLGTVHLRRGETVSLALRFSYEDWKKKPHRK